MTAVSSIQISGETCSFAVLADIDAAVRAMKTCTNDFSSTTARRSEKSATILVITRRTARNLLRGVKMLCSVRSTFGNSMDRTYAAPPEEGGPGTTWKHLCLARRRMRGLGVDRALDYHPVLDFRVVDTFRNHSPVTRLTHVNFFANRALVSLFVCFVPTH